MSELPGFSEEGLAAIQNMVGRQYFYAESTNPLPAGTDQVRVEFDYDGGGIGKGGDVTLYVDGKKEGEGRVGQTIPFVFSLDETCDLGSEAGSPVSPDYGVRDNAFSGKVNWVQIDVGEDDYDHLISPEERLNFAMMRQ